MIGSGSTAAKLWIDIGADIRSAMANMRTIDRQVTQSATLVQRTNPILQGLGQGLGLAGIGSAVLATKAVVDLSKSTIDAASDLREAMTLSDQVFEANSAAMQDWAGGVADTFGQSQREALNFAAGFGTLFKNVGMGLDEVGDKSRALTRLAADLGSTFNRSAEEVAIALRSGLVGEVEPTRRLGIFLNETAVAAKAVEIGIARAGQELNDTQKVAARYAIIMQDTADSQGMFGRDSESLADAQKALGAELENLAATAGTMVLPAMVDLTNFLNTEGVPALENEIAGIEKLAAQAGELGTAAKAGVDGLGWMAAEMQENLELTADMLTFWDGYVGKTERGAQRVAAAQARAMSDLSNFAGKAEDDLVSLGPPIEAVADHTVAMAIRVVRANETAIASFDAMRSRLASAASGAAESIYGPLIAKGQLAATEREMATQREIIAHGRSTAAAGASSTAQVDAIGKQIEAIQELEAASDRAFAKRMAQYGDEIAAQLGILDTEERARQLAKRDADLAEQIAAAQGNVAAADPTDRAAAEARLTDLLEQQEENRLSDAADARRQELRDAQKAIDAIVAHEREATDEHKALAEAHANAKAIASQMAAAREAGDLQRVADLAIVLEAQKAEIAHLALEARHKDRQTDLEREKAMLEARRGAVAASGAAEVADAKQRLAELQKTRIELLASLASFGDQAAADTLLFSQEMQTAMITGTDEVRARITELRHELWLLRMDALEAAGALDLTGQFGAGNFLPGGDVRPRAHGGPARAGHSYLVGEDHPEILRMGSASGYIDPDVGDRHELQVPEMAASSGYGAGAAASTAPAVQYITVHFEGPVFDPYGDFTQRFAEQLQPALARAAGRSGA